MKPSNAKRLDDAVNSFGNFETTSVGKHCRTQQKFAGVRG